MPSKITDKWLKSLRATDSKQEYRDVSCPRLFVIVQPLGLRARPAPTVAFLYRASVGGRDLKRSLGRYPAVSYASARDAAAALSRELDAGRNPFVASAPTAPQLTVRAAFERYMEREGNRRKTASEKRAIFERELVALHDRPITEVTRAELRRIIAAKDEQHPQAARKLLAISKRFFQWCVTKGEDFTGLEINPAAQIAPMSDPVRRDRSLTPDELGWLLASLPAAGAQLRRADRMVTDEFPAIYELLLRTLLRKEEVFNLRRGMIQCDAKGAAEKIVLPDTKNGRPLAVWLHPSAARLLGGRLDVFPDARVFSAKACERPLNRVRRRMEALATAEGQSVAHWCLHDFRQSGNDSLAAMLDEDDMPRVSHFVRDRLLNHADPSVRARNYESHSYYHERKGALKLWNDYLDSLGDKVELLKAA